VTFKDTAGASGLAIHEAIAKLGSGGGPTLEDAIPFASGAGARGRMSKFDPCLPDPLFARLVAEDVLDVEGAQAALRVATRR